MCHAGQAFQLRLPMRSFVKIDNGWFEWWILHDRRNTLERKKEKIEHDVLPATPFTGPSYRPLIRSTLTPYFTRSPVFWKIQRKILERKRFWMSHRSPSQQRSRLEYKHEFKTITQAHKDNTLVNYETAGVHDWSLYPSKTLLPWWWDTRVATRDSLAMGNKS